MARDEKPTPSEGVVAADEIVAAHMEVNAIDEQIIDSFFEGKEDIDEADRSVIRAELKAGQAIAKANEDLQKARDRAEEKKQKVLQTASGPGYIAKVWGQRVAYQCAYCPWDSFELDQMMLHLEKQHVGYSGPTVYGQNGLPLPVEA